MQKEREMKQNKILSILCGIKELTQDDEITTADDAVFDIDGFRSRKKEYEECLSDASLSIFEICERIEVDYELFHIEAMAMSTIMPVCLKFVDSTIKASLGRQKQISALKELQQKYGTLTTEIVSESLYVDMATAKSLADSAKFDIVDANSYERYTKKDFLEDLDLQEKYANWFRLHPHEGASKARKAVGINIPYNTLVSGLHHLIDEGQILPCSLGMSPFDVEALRKSIVAHKIENPYATAGDIAKHFDVSVKVVQTAIEDATDQMRREKKNNYEIYFKRTLDRIEDVEKKCLERFDGSPKSSSRWLELVLMGVEKKIRMLGLNPPAELNINQTINLQTKEERDAIVEAYYSTDEADEMLAEEVKKTEPTNFLEEYDDDF